MKIRMLFSRRAWSQSGAITVMAAPMVIAFVGMAALTVDVGRAMVMRNELQNAADAAALEGARGFGGYFTPNSVTALSQANQAIVNLNKVENLGLQAVEGVVTVGNWTAATGFVAGAPALGSDPAVRVVVTRSDSNAGTGPLDMVFAPIVGFFSMDVAATSVAIISGESIEGSAALPIAIDRCLYTSKWNTVTDAPVSNATFNIRSAYANDNGADIETLACTSGQWTSLYDDANDANAVARIMANGSEDDLVVNTEIHIQPGKKASVYDDINARLALGPVYGYLPVVVKDINDPYNDENFADLKEAGNSGLPTIDFVPFQLTAASKKDNTVTGRFLTRAEAAVLIPEVNIRDSTTSAPRLVL